MSRLTRADEAFTYDYVEKLLEDAGVPAFAQAFAERLNRLQQYENTGLDPQEIVGVRQPGFESMDRLTRKDDEYTVSYLEGYMKSIGRYRLARGVADFLNKLQQYENIGLSPQEVVRGWRSELDGSERLTRKDFNFTPQCVEQIMRRMSSAWFVEDLVGCLNKLQQYENTGLDPKDVLNGRKPASETMERLTRQNEEYSVSYMARFMKNFSRVRFAASVADCLNKLQQYEDTGRTPQEIMESRRPGLDGVIKACEKAKESQRVIPNADLERALTSHDNR